MTTSEIKVRIIDVLSGSTSNIDIYLPSGTPDDSATTLLTTGITLAPRLQGISTSQGSLGGTLLVADVRGLGVNSNALSLALTTSGGIYVCQTRNVTKYGKLECLTKEGLAISSSLRLRVGTTSYSCSGPS